jgi:hypothetical protein
VVAPAPLLVLLAEADHNSRHSALGLAASKAATAA